MYGTNSFDLMTVKDDKGINVTDCAGIVFFTRVAAEDTETILWAQGGDSADQTNHDLAQTSTKAQEGEEVLALDVFRPTDRFIKPVLKGGSGEIFALKYGGRSVRGSQSMGINHVSAPLHGDA